MEEAVDTLAEIRSRIAILQQQELELELLLKSDGTGRYFGTNIDALVYTQKRHFIDWKGLSAYLRVPKRTISRFTKPQDVTCLKLVGKRKVA